MLRKEGIPDIILINEADWGMSRSGNEHVARLMAYSLGMNYAWGVEFIELSPGNEDETKKALDASDCPYGRRGVGFKSKVNALGLHGNAILSKYPLSDVQIVRFPGIEDIYGVNNSLTANGFELRLGMRMALYANVKVNQNLNIRVGCFHLQMLWDSRFEKMFQKWGKSTLQKMEEEHRKYDKDRIIIGGDGWGTNWCDEIEIPNMHEYAGGDWICAKGFKAKDFKRTKSGDISDHDMFSISLIPT